MPQNRLLGRDESYRVITLAGAGGQEACLGTVRRWRSLESLLLPIGEMLARPVAEENFVHVKACEVM